MSARGGRQTWLPCDYGYGDRMIKIAPDYLDSTFHDATYDGLAWLSSSICAAEIFDIDDAGYGLPQPLFVLVEGLSWFALSVRSGVTTYFEATPFERQRMMLHAFEKEGAPDEMKAKYRSGMTSWKEPASAADLDCWIDQNDGANTLYLWHLARTHRQEIEAIAF